MKTVSLVRPESRCRRRIERVRADAATAARCTSPSSIRATPIIVGATVTVTGAETATSAPRSRRCEDRRRRHRDVHRPRAGPLHDPGGVSGLRDADAAGRPGPQRREQAGGGPADPEARSVGDRRAGQAAGGGRSARTILRHDADARRDRGAVGRSAARCSSSCRTWPARARSSASTASRAARCRRRRRSDRSASRAISSRPNSTAPAACRSRSSRSRASGPIRYFTNFRVRDDALDAAAVRSSPVERARSATPTIGGGLNGTLIKDKSSFNLFVFGIELLRHAEPQCGAAQRHARASRWR